MSRTAYGTLLLGLALFTGLIAWRGVAQVGAILAEGGWGLALVPPSYLLSMAASTVAWRLLFPPGAPPLRRLLRGRWIGESVNNLLPVARIGGELVRARLMVLDGHSGPLSGATIVADVTLAVLSLIAFALVGAGLLVLEFGTREAVSDVLFGVGVLFALVWTFYLLQRRGLFTALARRLTRVPGARAWLRLVGGAQRLDRHLNDIYARRGRMLHAFLWRLLGWALGAGETWLAFYVLGFPVSVSEALLLESLAMAMRSAGFVIPGGLGVQEGGFMLFASMVGLGTDVALGVSLAKRLRELVLGLPGLLVWQMTEGRHLAQDHAPSQSVEGESCSRRDK